MNGGDLRFHISRKSFTEDAVKFWIAELGCALRYVHQQRIVHRDIKPDNVLLDAEGHVHLGDFNVATNIVPGRPCSSRSGTLAYLAPEVYAGRGYYQECDWWSLGVLFYECIYNKRPFVASNHDDLAQLITKADPPFPQTNPPVSNPCLHAISSLLEKNKRQRIGASGFDSFTQNPFFQDLDFDALERKEIEPVFVPSSEKTNFDATYDLEELLLEEAPLEARARKQKPRAELRPDATLQEIQLEKWHRYIDTYFTPFDYTVVPPERAPVDPSTQLPGTSSGRQTPLQRSPKGEQSVPAAVDETTPPTSSPERQLNGTNSIGRLSEDKLNNTSQRKRNKFFTTTLTQNNDTNSTTGPKTDNSTRSSTLSPRISPTSTPSAFADSVIPAGMASSHGYATPAIDRDHETRYTHSRILQHDSASITSGPMVRANTSSPSQRPRCPKRSMSVGGSLIRDDTLPRPSGEQRRSEKPSGMLGFLNRKKGRDRSPKAKERERGVLGKEGARVVVKD
jgi:serine/threonine kinase 32